jgi:hypothetical protein
MRFPSSPSGFLLRSSSYDRTSPASPFGLGASPFGLGASPFGLRPHKTTPQDDPTRRMFGFWILEGKSVAENLPGGLTGSAKIGNSSQTAPPLFWVAGRMKDAVDDHLPTGILVKNGVRKSPNQCTAILLVDFCIQSTSCCASGAIISSAAIVTLNPVFNLVPRKT